MDALSKLRGLRGLREEYRESRTNGIDVWDCVNDEDALAIPWVLAFQGDNPMASEFASHIGMSGRCICRVCEVYARQETQGGEARQETQGGEAHRPTSRLPGSESDTLGPERQRVIDFLTVSDLVRLPS